MAKIQVTDDADAKKKSAAEAAKKTAKSSVSKKSVKRVSVDTTSVTPKKIKRIKVEKTEKKSPKKTPKKSVKIEKAEPKKTEITVKKTTAKAEKTEIIVEKKSEAETTQSTKTIKHSSSKSAVSSNATHSILQKSTTLSRRFVKRPENESKKDVEKSDNEKAPEQATPVIITQSATVDPEPEKASEAEVKISINTPSSDSAQKKESVKIDRAKAKKERQAEKLARAEARLAEKRMRAEAEATRKAKAKAEKLAAIEAAKARKEAAARAAREAKLAKKQARVAMPSLKSAKTASSAAEKDNALRSAMRSVATMNAAESPKEMHREFRKKKKGGRVVLALLCSAITVGALVAFVHFNMPDISVRVAAMQTGIDASYPNIIPRGYTLSNVSSDKDGEIAMVFRNSDDSSFTMTEEKSTWDSNALLNNYVKKVMSSDYSTMREQGITIYSEGDSAAWVNGGILFKVKSSGKFLTKEQIRNLATSV